MMRITEYLSGFTFLQQIRSARTDIYRSNEHIATGKKVTKASDDPPAFLTSRQLENHIRRQEQFVKNAETGLYRTRTVQDALDRMGDLLIGIKNLATEAASDNKSAADRQNLAGRISALKEELVELGNSRSGDLYLFAGSGGDSKPFTADGTAEGGIRSWGTDQPVMVQIGDGFSAAVTLTASELRETEEGDLFAILQDTVDALESNDGETVRESLDRITAALDHVNGLSTRMASVINRLDYTTGRLRESVILASGEASRLTDADVIESMIRQTAAQNSYDALLATQGRMQQTSLLQYLR